MEAIGGQSAPRYEMVNIVTTNYSTHSKGRRHPKLKLRISWLLLMVGLVAYAQLSRVV